MGKIRHCVLTCFAALVASAEPVSQLHPTGYVNDFAHVLDQKTVAQLENLCQQVDQQTHAQLAVVTINSLDGEGIESYALTLFNSWGIGNKATNLEAVLGTFGETAQYDDEPWNEHYQGRDGVRQFYGQLMKALPDLEIDVQRRHITDDTILLEVVIRGTHLGGWRGLPATGRRVEFPLGGVYVFDGDDRLARERIYYDRGTVLRQLGVFHEPQTVLGQIAILATHPVTVARAFARKFLGK